MNSYFKELRTLLNNLKLTINTKKVVKVLIPYQTKKKH